MLVELKGKRQLLKKYKNHVIYIYSYKKFLQQKPYVRNMCEKYLFYYKIIGFANVRLIKVRYWL